MAEQSQYVTLGVAGDLYAAPVERVHEILAARGISRLPRAPRSFLGIIDVRGQNVPVVDLRSSLGLPETEDTENTRIMVLSFNAPEGEQIIGLKTDRVYEVTVLDDARLEPAPDMVRGWNTQAIAGIGRKNGAFVTVLDIDAFFAGLPAADAAEPESGCPHFIRAQRSAS